MRYLSKMILAKNVKKLQKVYISIDKTHKLIV